jgi:hypothetical protein
MRTRTWLKVGAVFFCLGGALEYGVIKSGYYDIMRKNEAKRKWESQITRNEWIQQWREQGIELPRELLEQLEQNDDDNGDE